LAGIGVYAVYPLLKKRRPACRIRIIATPPGEAPESVRRSWVGLELPLPRGDPGWPRKLSAVGVLSNQTGEAVRGYVVDGKVALLALEFHDSAAARWWRENVPDILSGAYQLGFPAEVCERIDLQRT